MKTHHWFAWIRSVVKNPWQRLRQGIRTAWLSLKNTVWGFLRGAAYLLWKLVLWCLDFLFYIGSMSAFRLFVRMLIVMLVVLALVSILLAIAVKYPYTQIPEHDLVKGTVYLDQGWGTSASSEDRQAYYYTPQGTSLNNLRYSWFVNLDEAWSHRRISEVENMRSLGFIVDDASTKWNPDRLPVGFTKHFDPHFGEDVLDITCAACHTGELHATTRDQTHLAIRIDGGQAMHAFTAISIGNFGPSLLASMAATYLNPLKFNDFARRVLGDEHYASGKSALRSEFRKVMWAFFQQAYIDSSRHLYPVTEGFGRTDAIGRISNKVFAEELDPANYRVGNAPVSYPPVWDIWKFNWVQYTASVSQPMARNLGESLGVGAAIGLVDLYGRPVPSDQRFAAPSMMLNLYTIEGTLKKLQPPKWPAEILGPIDQAKANYGRTLYQKYCAGCHQPCELSPEERAVRVPDRNPKEPFWRIQELPVEEIGTDPTAALNFVNNRVDLSKTGLTDDDVRAILKPIYDEEQKRAADFRKKKNLPPRYNSCEYQQKLDAVNVRSVAIGEGLNYLGILASKRYYSEHGIPLEKQRQYNGDGALDIPQVVLIYKARPLAGVWATGPYLHNGSVPTLYELLLPADERRKRFFMGRKEFDPDRVGVLGEPLSKSGFWFDTTIQGNFNIGHEFRAGYATWRPGALPSHGVIGPELKDEERWAIIEYLKIHEDTDAPACKPLALPPSYATCTDTKWAPAKETPK